MVQPSPEGAGSASSERDICLARTRVLVHGSILSRGVQSSLEGFNPLARGSILSRGVQSSLEGSNPLARGSILSRGAQSSREGFNPLSRGPILSRGVQSSLEGFRGSVSSERDGCLARARVYPPRVSGLKMRSFGAPPFQDKSSPLGCLDLLRFFFWCSSLSGQVFPPGAFGPFCGFS
jgi:hypothetical protein